MNEQDRAELERLKQRLVLLQSQLPDLEGLAGELRRISQQTAALEERLRTRTPAENTAAAATGVITSPEAQEPPPRFKPVSLPGSVPDRAPVLPPPIPPVIPPPAPRPPPAPSEKPALVQTLSAEPVEAVSASRVQPPASMVEPVAAPASEPPKRASFEMRLGTYWLVRVGIVMLLTALVFLANLAYRNWVPKLGPGGKVALLYLGSFALLGVGAWLYRRQEKVRNYAQVLIAGGLAAVYFTTYAAHHVPALRVIGNAVLDGGLLLAWAGFIVWLADRKRSEVLALFAIVLGYYTAVITRVGLFTLYSNLVLTVAAVFFLVRNRWATLSYVSLVASYVSYAFWRFFHGGEWRWATPEEGLWTGTYFLVCYWAVFTAAVFLSRHEAVAGRKRASFASLNNGEFLGLFLLTMLQVRQGGFWKVALVYGAVLLALAALARRLLREEKQTANAYLSQGLVLLTLAFVTKFSGFRLALVLAAESVVLALLWRLLESRVMRAGSWITGALAVAWGVVTTRPMDRGGLIAGAVIGAAVLFNGLWSRREKPSSGKPLSEEMGFTALALIMWAVTSWQNTADDWRALVLAAESCVFLIAGGRLPSLPLRAGAYPFAVMAIGRALVRLIDQGQSFPLARRTGLGFAVAVGALLVFNAWWERRAAPPDEDRRLGAPAGFFSALGLAVWLVATWTFASPQFLAPLLTAEALLFTASFYGLRVSEVTVFGQLFLVLAQVSCLYHFASGQSPWPWWNPLSVIAGSLAAGYWWQRQQTLSVDEGVTRFLQALFGLAVVGVLFFWFRPQFTPAGWLAFSGALAVAVTAYGAITRGWFLAGWGQLFVLVTGYEFLRQVVISEGPMRAPEWSFALAPIGVLAMLGLAAAYFAARIPSGRFEYGDGVKLVGQIYRVVALAMILAWVFEYVPRREQVWVLVAVGAALFGWSGLKISAGPLVASALFTVVGLATFALRFDKAVSVYGPNLLAILLVLAEQRAARRLAPRFNLPEQAHNALIVMGGLALWLFISRWVIATSGSGRFYLTASWAALSFLVFATGFVFRERMHRWLGLGILMCALGRVVVFDVWKLETLYRILSFFALGIVLLALGYIYNRYQEKIREWL